MSTKSAREDASSHRWRDGRAPEHMSTKSARENVPAPPRSWAVLDALTDATALLDAGGVVRYLNTAWRRLLEESNTSVKDSPCEGEACCGLRALLIASDARADEVLSSIHAVIAGDRERFEGTLAYRAGDQDRWRAVVAAPCEVDDARGALVQVWDISERVATAEENRRLVEQARTAQRRSEALAEVNAHLSRVVDEQDVVAAVAHYARRSRATSVSLSELEVDEEGTPVRAKIIASVRDGDQPVRHNRSGTFVPISQLSTTPYWVSAHGAPLIIEDTRADPRVQGALKERLSSISVGAVMLIPLYSEGSASWEGLISISWAEPRKFDAEERCIYESLAHALPDILASRRTAMARRQLNDVLEATPDMVGIANWERRFTYINPAGRAMLGLGQGADVSRYVLLDLYAPEARERMEREVLPAAERDGICSIEINLRRITGNELPTSQVVVAHKGTDGSVERLSAIIRDMSEHKRAEQERLALKEDLIRAQAAALAERSTPLIPISDEVMVMPLIGTVDDERARQATEALLHGCAKAKASVAIVDITGVPSLDAQSAGGLLRAASALRLLGVEVVLTGIRAEVAQTLVSLHVDMSGITTRGTLMSGIAYSSSPRTRRSRSPMARS
jgi:PAS domain S-box-containing protein